MADEEIKEGSEQESSETVGTEPIDIGEVTGTSQTPSPDESDSESEEVI